MGQGHETGHDMDTPRRLARSWPLLLLAGLVGLAWASGATRLLSFEALGAHRATLDAWVAARPILAAGAYVLTYVVVVALSLPGGVVMTLAGGLLFGAWIGTGLTVVGATIGAWWRRRNSDA